MLINSTEFCSCCTVAVLIQISGQIFDFFGGGMGILALLKE
jgi:hypothetical protein